MTGACTPRSPSAQGFKVRIRYTDGRNMTLGRISDFRVLWIAATNKHAGLGDFPSSSVAAQAELLRQLIHEEPQVVKGLLGTTTTRAVFLSFFASDAVLCIAARNVCCKQARNTTRWSETSQSPRS